MLWTTECWARLMPVLSGEVMQQSAKSSFKVVTDPPDSGTFLITERQLTSNGAATSLQTTNALYRRDLSLHMVGVSKKSDFVARNAFCLWTKSQKCTF